MQTFFETLRHTPWPVYALFAYLLMRGFRATKTHTVSLLRLCILPTIFVILSINTLITSPEFSIETFLLFVFSLVAGNFVGWLLVRNWEIVPVGRGIRIPGNWSTLVLILLSFSAKYTVGYVQATNLDLATAPAFVLSMVGISAFCAGVFEGRLIGYLLARAKVKAS